jgi:hypothetical protein
MILYTITIIACGIIIFAELNYGRLIYSSTWDLYLNFYVLQSMNTLYNLQVDTGAGTRDYLIKQVLAKISNNDIDGAEDLLVENMIKLFRPIKDNFYFYVSMGWYTGGGWTWYDFFLKYEYDKSAKKGLWYKAFVTPNADFRDILNKIMSDNNLSVNVYTVNAPILVTDSSGTPHNGFLYVGFIPKTIDLKDVISKFDCGNSRCELNWEEINPSNH